MHLLNLSIKKSLCLAFGTCISMSCNFAIANISNTTDDIFKTPESITLHFIKQANYNCEKSNELYIPKDLTTPEYTEGLTKFIEANSEEMEGENGPFISMSYDPIINGQDCAPYPDSFKVKLTSIDEKEGFASVLAYQKGDSEHYPFNCYTLKKIRDKWLVHNFKNIFPNKDNKYSEECKISKDFPM